MPLEFIEPDWLAPTNVRCVTTTRRGGFSKGDYDSFNLGGHVKDSIEFVNQNRQLLNQELKLESEPVWLDQVHGTHVLELDTKTKPNITADAAYTNVPGVVCTVLTADCLPVVFCDRAGRHIAVAHAGWRGLVKGVLESTLQKMPVASEDVICWLGPAIGPKVFEVGEEVLKEFLNTDVIHENAFKPHTKETYLADIYQLAKNVLTKQGVRSISGGGRCTFSESDKFYSFRRDGETGRMATIIWKCS